jgi:hypothetical protein
VNESPTTFETWGILEVMGHIRLAGRISEQVVAGSAMVRVDVPAVADRPPFTRLFGAGSIYSLTPTTEEIAFAVAQTLRAQPLQPYDLPTKFRQQFLPHAEDAFDD